MHKRVVITGMGVVTSLGRGIEVNALALKDGRPGISTIRSFDSSKHRTNQGGEVSVQLLDHALDNSRKCQLDRSSRLLLIACRDALEMAKLMPTKGDFLRAPLVVGTTLGGMLAAQRFHRAMLLKEDIREYAFLMRDSISCHQPFHVASIVGIIGETAVLSNACASGSSAIGCAYERVRNGKNAFVIAGGYDEMSEFTHAGFNSLQLVTSDKCRPFDRNRSGLVLGEGAGVMVIEEIEHAIQRKVPIHAEIIGFGQASDAYHITKPDPEAKGAACAIRMAIEEAKINPESIDYVNAHGTGTYSNDTMESRALYLALGSYAKKIPVSSTKPFTGHLLGAAGAVEAIFSVISLQKGFIPENFNFTTPDPECELNIITGASRAANPKIILSNSFGFGGANAALLLRKFN